MKAGKLQTGNTFPKQYWLAVNGKPKRKPSGTTGGMKTITNKMAVLTPS